MRRLGKRSDPKEYLGCSWIEDKNIVLSFVAGSHHKLDDKFLLSFPRSTEVKAKETKYRDMLSIQEEEMEETGGVHSEKLALAFSLIRYPQTPRSIRIVKNLKMCEHCHRVANRSLRRMGVTYQCFHWKKGTLFADDQGIYNRLTWWEQIENGKQLTPNRKLLTVAPVVLYLIASHTIGYQHPMLFFNTLAVFILVVAKFPHMHKVRIFGIIADQ
ncbi:ORM1 3 [Olea europaea subsp. europaea]|uniref:ORM1 3 n=1 Tax=Olea europaea subsp. europaea TaxID=158383 RepID=A0A8S0PWX1_OLEEU|nr:ORM1 3 [Olea europaea subsp. europaea]